METKDILKQLREKHGYSIKDVSTGTKMQYTMCREYESGDRKLGMSAAIKFADFYHVSIDYLLGRQDSVSQADCMEQLIVQYNLTTIDHAFITSYLDLSQVDRMKLIELLNNLISSIK